MDGDDVLKDSQKSKRSGVNDQKKDEENNFDNYDVDEMIQGLL